MSHIFTAHFVQRKQFQRKRISTALADIVNEHGNVHTVIIDTKKGRDVRQYMNEIDSCMVRIDHRHIENHLDLVMKIVRTTIIMRANLDEYHNQSYSMDSIAFLNSKFENINSVIDAYNDYVLDKDTNPFIRQKYQPLEKIDLDGVWLIGKTGKVENIGSTPVIEEIPIKPIVTEHDKKVIASKATYVWRDVL